ncbi:MAG: hypothetical protein LBT40_13220 [Deltaproteobacteria bacterium]|jgi:biotin-(acetyl-CoA carboxylase) ligase|nr:hypothetical protein [Deltaproteobacteria bacterium]
MNPDGHLPDPAPGSGTPLAYPSRELLEIRGGLLYRAGTVPSALDSAWELYAEGKFPVFSTLVAERQTRGRGRLGRTWASPPGHVYASVRLPLEPPFEDSAAPVALAFWLSLALDEVTGLRLLIKWPNDLVLDGAKAGGILLENRKGALMAGVGLNIGSPPDLGEAGAARDPYAPPPGALPVSRLPPGGPCGLWKELAINLIMRYNVNSALRSPVTGAPSARTPVLDRSPGPGPSKQGSAKGFAGMRELAASRLFGLGRKIAVSRPAPAAFEGETSLEGRMAGLDVTGALLVETRQGTRSLWSGTVLFPEG